MTGMLFYGCVNDLDSIDKVTYDPKAPVELAENLEVVYKDSGFAQMKIFATTAETYRVPDHHTKLKDGLKIDFYSTKGEVVSTLTSYYGEINITTGKFYVRDSVVLYNYKKKQYLETEELFWNQNDSTIYTEKNVVIRTEGRGITGRGKGLKTTQSFDKYVISKPVGTIILSAD